MAATVVPGQPQRWGNESTNFYQSSFTSTPGVPSRQKVYRCTGHQYTNSGHYHIGTKAINQWGFVELKYNWSKCILIRPSRYCIWWSMSTYIACIQAILRGYQPLHQYNKHSFKWISFHWRQIRFHSSMTFVRGHFWAKMSSHGHAWHHVCVNPTQKPTSWQIWCSQHTQTEGCGPEVRHAATFIEIYTRIITAFSPEFQRHLLHLMYSKWYDIFLFAIYFTLIFPPV